MKRRAVSAAETRLRSKECLTWSLTPFPQHSEAASESRRVPLTSTLRYPSASGRTDALLHASSPVHRSLVFCEGGIAACRGAFLVQPKEMTRCSWRRRRAVVSRAHPADVELAKRVVLGHLPFIVWPRVSPMGCGAPSVATRQPRGARRTGGSLDREAYALI